MVYGNAAVNFYDWMLALHLLAAFSVAAALVLYSVLVVSGRRNATLEHARMLFRVAPIATPLIAAGSVLVLIFGVILAIDGGPQDFKIWNAWVIIGIVLWALLAAAGQRTGAYYTAVQERAESDGAEQEVIARLQAPTGALLHLATLAVFVLLVLDMIFKPWA
jgi:uncharacterized membrane protein